MAAWLDLGAGDGVLGAPRVDTRPIGNKRLELTVCGILAPDWAARMTGRLARLDLNIVRGSATLDEHRYWTSRFEIEYPSTRDIGRFGDRLSVPRDAPPPSSGGLEQHKLTPSDEHGGTLRLDVVEAHDCVGFLASLFWKIKEHELVPSAFVIDTRYGYVFDTVWLRTQSASMPGPEVSEALRTHLDELIAA